MKINHIYNLNGIWFGFDDPMPEEFVYTEVPSRVSEHRTKGNNLDLTKWQQSYLCQLSEKGLFRRDDFVMYKGVKYIIIAIAEGASLLRISKDLDGELALNILPEEATNTSPIEVKLVDEEGNEVEWPQESSFGETDVGFDGVNYIGAINDFSNDIKRGKIKGERLNLSERKLKK